MVFVQNGLQRYKLFSKKQCHQLKLFESEEKRQLFALLFRLWGDSYSYPDGTRRLLKYTLVWG
jgi:hypothetical protein